MAKVKSTDQLLELARRSRLVEEDRITDFVATLEAGQDSAPQTVDDLAAVSYTHLTLPTKRIV